MMTSPFSRFTAMSGNSKVIMSLKFIQRHRMSSLFVRPSSQRRFCYGWLAMFFTGRGLAVNKEVYISKCLPVPHTLFQKHHKNEKIVFWPDLASAHYAKDTLVEYVHKEESPRNVPQIRPIEKILAIEKEGLQQQLSSKRCKVVDGKDQKRVEVH
jgi:hypothetical protein